MNLQGKMGDILVDEALKQWKETSDPRSMVKEEVLKVLRGLNLSAAVQVMIDKKVNDALKSSQDEIAVLKSTLADVLKQFDYMQKSMAAMNDELYQMSRK